MKILFLSHDASRTGAPIVLLHLIRWVSRQPEVQFDMLFLKGGDLLPEFEKLGKVTVMPEESKTQRVYRKLRNQKPSISKRLASAVKMLGSHDHDVIYANTIVGIGPAIRVANQYTVRPKVLGHIHELKLVIAQFSSRFKDFANKADHYIVASKIVGRNLENYGVTSDNIDVVYEFSATENSPSAEQGTAGDKLVIGGSGTVHWRKGHDAFIQVAQYVKNHHPQKKIYFQWVGRMAERDERIVREDLRKSGLEERVEFIGETDEPGKYFQKFDIFLMTSREDPFPLVCIEVGQFGVPIICFEGATGTQEVIESGGGKIVPFLDIKAMGDAVIEYYNDRDTLIEDSQKAREIFSGFTPERICPQIFEVIKKTVQI